MDHATRLAALFVALLLLAGCGLFGDDDQSASPAEEAADITVTSLRVESGDRWFDINPSQIELNDTGVPTPETVSQLERQVTNLSLDLRRPVDAGIEHDGDEFSVIPSIAGQTPDIETLARQISAAVDAGVDTVAIPMSDVAAEVTDEDAAGYAAELNDRVGDGVEVAIGGQKALLTASALGPATDVAWANGDWQVRLDYDRVDAELARLFPDVGQEGGEATFTVEYDDDIEDDPGTVVIVPGAPKTICCDEASARRIEQAITTELDVATLLFKSVEGERGTEWATSLGIDENIGSFTTSYTAGQSRVTNIRLIAELTQGVILQPGETFSLNEYVGRRTTEKGFVPAGTIVNGHLVDSVGGGISQFATTLFNAAFFGGLEFESYQSHSIYFSRYPYGREATISWPAPELKISNPTPHAVLIWPTSTANSVSVDLYSTKWAEVEQTGQWEGAVGAACTRVTTERTRTLVEDDTEIVDTVFATYRPEGIACDGSETDNPDEEQIEKLEDGEDPGFENGDPPETGGDGVPPEEQPGGDTPTSSTTTTVAPNASSTTTVAPTETTSTTSTTTTSTSSTTTQAP